MSESYQAYADIESGVKFFLPDLKSNEVGDVADFIVGILEQLRAAKRKYPSTEAKVAALGSEFGEVVTAVLREPWENVVTEAQQLCGVAMRLALEGDCSLLQYRDRMRLETPPDIRKAI